MKAKEAAAIWRQKWPRGMKPRIDGESEAPMPWAMAAIGLQHSHIIAQLISPCLMNAAYLT